MLCKNKTSLHMINAMMISGLFLVIKTLRHVMFCSRVKVVCDGGFMPSGSCQGRRGREAVLPTARSAPRDITLGQWQARVHLLSKAARQNALTRPVGEPGLTM